MLLSLFFFVIFSLLLLLSLLYILLEFLLLLAKSLEWCDDKKPPFLFGFLLVSFYYRTIYAIVVDQVLMIVGWLKFARLFFQTLFHLVIYRVQISHLDRVGQRFCSHFNTRKYSISQRVGLSEAIFKVFQKSGKNENYNRDN